MCVSLHFIIYTIHHNIYSLPSQDNATHTNIQWNCCVWKIELINCHWSTQPCFCLINDSSQGAVPHIYDRCQLVHIFTWYIANWSVCLNVKVCYPLSIEFCKEAVQFLLPSQNCLCHWHYLWHPIAISQKCEGGMRKSNRACSIRTSPTVSKKLMRARMKLLLKCMSSKLGTKV